MALPSPAETGVLHVRELLTATSKLYSSYVHVMGAEHAMRHEYCNISDGRQQITAVLLTQKGELLPRAEIKRIGLEPKEFMDIDTSQWVRDAFAIPFSGQLMLLIEQVTSHSAVPILPAITAHWISPSHFCEIATDAFERVNLTSFQRKKSFYMFCPMAVCDQKRTTLITLFNHSTDPAYDDTVEINIALGGMDGRQLEGPIARIDPFGVLVLNVAEHFGSAGQKFFAENAGRASLTARHLGHTFPAFFFHIDRTNGDILCGQHSQPPISAITRPGIWWGKLRQFGL